MSLCSCPGCKHHFADALWSPQAAAQQQLHNLLDTSWWERNPSHGCRRVLDLFLFMSLVCCWLSWCYHTYFQMIKLNVAFGCCGLQSSSLSSLAKLFNEQC